VSFGALRNRDNYGSVMQTKNHPKYPIKTASPEGGREGGNYEKISIGLQDQVCTSASCINFMQVIYLDSF